MRPQNQKVSVILATYNESELIAKMIQSLYQEIAPPLEVIVVDDQSPDGTADIVEKLNFPELKLIRRKVKGLASAFHRGILESRGDIVCWMDADMCMPAGVLLKLIDQLDQCDIAVGSRYAEGGSDNRHPLRVWSSRGINKFAEILLGGGIKDYDSGFVALKRQVFDQVTLMPYGYGDYFIEFLFDAHQNGLKIKEIGFSFCDRAEGISKSFSSLFSFCWTGFWYFFRICKIRIISFLNPKTQKME